MVMPPLHFRTGGLCFLDNSCLRAVRQTTLLGQVAFKSSRYLVQIIVWQNLGDGRGARWLGMDSNKKSRNNPGSLIVTVMEGSNITSFIILIIIRQFVGRLPWAYPHPPLGNMGIFPHQDFDHWGIPAAKVWRDNMNYCGMWRNFPFLFFLQNKLAEI